MASRRGRLSALPTPGCEKSRQLADRLTLASCGGRRWILLDPWLFARKTILVVLGSYALIPLIAAKSTLPRYLYVSSLIAIHVAVLGVYLYRVRFRSLDPDRRSLGARVLGLVVMIWLLSVVSSWQDRVHLGVLAAQMLVMCLVHTLVLALLMVACERREYTAHRGVPVDVEASVALPSRGQHVLIVVDMQRDYDRRANVSLYGEVRSPYANDINTIVPAINRVRRARPWDAVVYTFDWLPAEMLAGRTPFCAAGSAGAELLDELAVESRDVLFKKDSDDSFCEEGGCAEATTRCTRLADVLSVLGHSPERAELTFVGQRLERCMLKTVMHAVDLGYACTVIEDATFEQTLEPDPEWGVGNVASEGPPQVYRARKSAGGRLALGYMQAAGVAFVGSL